MRAGGVVGDHAADGRAVGGRDVGGELQTERLHRWFRSSSTQPGSTRHPPLGGVDLENAVEVLEQVEDDARADRLARLRGAAAACAVIGTPNCEQIFNVARTSSAVFGKTTPSGTIW